jgi:hypothetical protein
MQRHFTYYLTVVWVQCKLYLICRTYTFTLASQHPPLQLQSAEEHS